MFAGSRVLSDKLKEHFGWKSTTVDDCSCPNAEKPSSPAFLFLSSSSRHAPRARRDYKVDVRDYKADDAFDYAHASVPCATFSFLGNHRSKENPLGTTPEAAEANEVLEATADLFDGLQRKNANVLFTLENPKGWLQHHPIMRERFESKNGLGLRKLRLCYCLSPRVCYFVLF